MRQWILIAVAAAWMGWLSWVVLDAREQSRQNTRFLLSMKCPAIDLSGVERGIAQIMVGLAGLSGIEYDMAKLEKGLQSIDVTVGSIYSKVDSIERTQAPRLGR